MGLDRYGAGICIRTFHDRVSMVALRDFFSGAGVWLPPGTYRFDYRPDSVSCAIEYPDELVYSMLLKYYATFR